MLNEVVCPECGTELSGEPWGPNLCPHCSFALALELAPEDSETAGVSEEQPTLRYTSQTLTDGHVLGNRYRVRTLLGRGGMGEVWRAFDLKLRVDIALKSLRQELLADHRALEALRQEVRTAREVISPNVCRVFDLVELEGQELVSMEYIDGITLSDILTMRAPLELTEAREMASQFLAGLEAIHEAGLVHRDVKPENIMMTRAGRIVVMDFGIAKGLADRRTGTVSGTPAYMAPEQARGEAVTARADVFSAGVILAEMTTPDGVSRHELRAGLWESIHQDPPAVPDSDWAPVLKRALAHRAEDRYPSAAALARALEEVTLQGWRDEGIQPYPGLASFTQEDAEFFFGRELEVEEMWKKLRRPHLLGLIGPSGAGKSSFLRAGLLAVIPTGWRAVVAAPGAQPFVSLARALARELVGDEEAIQDLLQFDNPAVAVSVVNRWRQSHDQVLIIVDQFEELFTQNSEQVQRGFSELLGKLAVETDAHILVSMRDDFLFYCSSQPALAPMFSELTPLRPPLGTALRRSIVQPALKCGFKFEDESLIDEMVEEVGSERGALPLLAFAAARLWGLRDRERGLLTREAYEHIGGVGGALAQHAEAALEEIGQDRVAVVRELFRNLVTAQGTRAARERRDLVSVFSEDGAQTAESVLDALIDARLLTSYEVPAANDGEAPSTKIEIIHESLLSNWPRLVRWQTQDADSAQLRDQVRQAAQLWKERGRPDDLLWTGTSFGEYRLWRERYQGGLSSYEEEFAVAMVGKAERAKRRRRWVLAAVISVLAIGLAIVGGFWWQAEESRRRAEKEALRAEASKLLTLGRLELEDNPTAALAYVRKSLELADSPGARRFALEILWRGPVATILPARAASIGFSPDGQFMAVGGGGGMDSETLLYDADGRRTLILDGVDGVVSQWFALTPDNRLLVRHAVYPRGGGGFVSRNDRWLLPEGQQLAPIEWSEGFEDGVEGRLGPNGLLTFTWHRPEVQFEFWPTGQLATDSPLARTLGSWSRGGEGSAFAMNAGLTRVAWRGGRDGDEVFLRSLDLSDHSDPRRIGRHRGWIDRLSLSADGGLLASRTKSELKIWSLDTQGDPKVTDLKGLENPETYCPPLIDPDSSRIAQVSMALQSAFIWDLEVPLDHRPQILPRRGSEFLLGASHPSGDWLATTHYEDVAFWPQNWPSVRTLDPGQDPGFNWMSGLAFSPDSKWLASCSAWTPPHLWPMEAGLGPDRILGSIGCLTPAFDPPGENLLVTKAVPPVAMVPIDESEPRILPETGATDSTLRMIYALGLSPSGRRAAAAVSGGFGAEVDRVLRIWDLASEEEQVFDQMQDCLVEKGGTDSGCGINSLQFASEDTLFTAGDSGIRQWNLDLGHSQWVLRDSGKLYSGLDLGPDGRFLVTIGPDAAMDERSANRILLLDLEEGTHRTIESRGEEPSAVILDASGQILVSGDSEGTLYVGPVEGGESHLLLGHDSQIVAVALSPDGQWIASATSDEIRVWPMPDLNKKPLHTLPYDEFLAKLRDLTNLLAVEDPESSSGWKLEVGPFPGWKEVPSWQE